MFCFSIVCRFGQLEAGIALERVVDRPAGREYQKASAAVILQQLHIAGEVQLLEILHRRFDDQGVPTFGKDLIEKGVLKTLLHNRKTAALLGAETTANAYKAGASAPLGVTPTNLYFTPSDRSRAQLLEEMGEGVFITNVKGLHAAPRLREAACKLTVPEDLEPFYQKILEENA